MLRLKIRQTFLLHSVDHIVIDEQSTHQKLYLIPVPPKKRRQLPNVYR